MRLGLGFAITTLALSFALMAQAEETFNPTLRSITAAEWQRVMEIYCPLNWPDEDTRRACLKASAVDAKDVSKLPDVLLAALRANMTRDSVAESGAWPHPEPAAITATLEKLGLERGEKEIGFKRDDGVHGFAFTLMEVRPIADLRDNQGSSFYIVSVEW